MFTFPQGLLDTIKYALIQSIFQLEKCSLHTNVVEYDQNFFGSLYKADKNKACLRGETLTLNLNIGGVLANCEGGGDVAIQYKPFRLKMVRIYHMKICSAEALCRKYILILNKVMKL